MKEKFSLTMVVGANLATTFALQILTISIMGFDGNLDIFLLSSATSQFIAAILVMPLSNILLIFFSRMSRADAFEHLSIIISVIFAISIIATLILFFSSGFLAKIFGSNYSYENKLMLQDLMEIQSLSIVFLGLFYVYITFSRSLKLFFYSEFCALVISLIILILAYYFLPKYGCEFLAWVAVFRPFGVLVLLMFKIPPEFKIFSNNLDLIFLKRLWRDLYPLMCSSLIFKSEAIVDRIILSTAAPGTMALYNFSQQIYGAGIQLFEKVFALPISQNFASINPITSSNIKKKYNYEIKRICTLLIFAFIFLLFFGKFILSLVIGYGKVTEENINELWITMILLFGVIAGAILGQISMAIFYCLGKTKLIATLSAISYCLYIPIKIITYNYFGIYGFILSTSAHYMVDFYIQNYRIKKILN